MVDGKWLRFDVGRIFILARSSSGLGRRPLKAETTGSNPVRATALTKQQISIHRGEPNNKIPNLSYSVLTFNLIF